MKFQFRYLSLVALCLAIIVSSCEKDPVTSDLRIVESVAIAEGMNMQQEFLLEAIANNWDQQILPTGSSRIYKDTNRFAQKFQIDFGKMQLCGDFISRTGKINIFQYNSNGSWDSLLCVIDPKDSFGIQSAFGTVYITGKFSLFRRDVIQVKTISNFKLYVKNGWDFLFHADCLVNRMKKNPTQLDFHDGTIIYGQCNLMKDHNNLDVKSEIIGVSKPFDAPNFPIAGELNCELNTGELVQVYFDPYSNLQFDKVAKGKFGDSEWFFDFQ